MPPEGVTSKSNRDDALAVVRRLRECGHAAYFAGGCVRDLILGGDPKDYDVATDAPPRRVRELFFNTQAVGAAFGVILVRVGASVIEVATFRSDGAYLDGRHPAEVRFTTAEEDARRRDFTINGLFLDPITDSIIDFVGGRDDLHHRRIRAIGDPVARFSEDSLRLLRAVRFAARLDFTIEPLTFQAIRSHAGQLRRISPERIAEELRLMLSSVSRGAAWELLWKLDLVHEIFRFLPVTERSGAGSAPMLFPLVCAGEPVHFGLALAAATLCYWLQTRPRVVDVRPLFLREEVLLAAHALRQSLKISNEETEALRETLLGIGPLLADLPPSLAARKRFLARPTASLSRGLLNAVAAHGMFSDRIVSLQAEFADLDKTEVAPPPLITGDDLAALGLAPGPTYKQILDTVYDAQLEANVTTEAEASALARQLIHSPKPDPNSIEPRAAANR